MCNWTRKIAESCEILLMILKEEIRSGPLINIDETPFQVLNEPNRSSQTKSYMWVFKEGLPEHPGILFEYHPTRAGGVPILFLDGYEGVVQTDGYKAYNFINDPDGMDHMGCCMIEAAFLSFIRSRKSFSEIIPITTFSLSRTGNPDISLFPILIIASINGVFFCYIMNIMVITCSASIALLILDTA